MDKKPEIIEQRLKSSLLQLQTEFGIFDRLVYKNKNQHRRSSYFQFLLKVRRDLRLLQSAKLEDIINSCFLVINGKRPKQKLQLLESLKWKTSHHAKHNFLERLLGVAHLLSQMVEPILRAATEISTLLAQSFFMGFSLTILALLARIRVLLQQMLLDVVFTYNATFSLSQKEQAIQIIEGGIQVFREYYPVKDEIIISLECVWQTDKFVLVENMKESTIQSQNEEIGEDVTVGENPIQYQSIDVLIGGDQPCSTTPDCPREVADSRKDGHISLLGALQQNNGVKEVKETSVPSPEQTTMVEGGGSIASLTPLSKPLKRKHASKEQVAFVSVKLPCSRQGE